MTMMIRYGAYARNSSAGGSGWVTRRWNPASVESTAPPATGCGAVMPPPTSTDSAGCHTRSSSTTQPAATSEALHQRAETERDDDGLYPVVVADPAERAAQHVEVAGLDGHVVDPDRVDHDPQDREQAEGRAQRGGEPGLRHRHRVHHGRDDQ